MERIIFVSGKVGLTNSTHELKDGIDIILSFISAKSYERRNVMDTAKLDNSTLITAVGMVCLTALAIAVIIKKEW